MLDHHWQFVQEAMSDCQEYTGDSEAPQFAPWSLGGHRLAWLAKAAVQCQHDEEAALVDTTTRQVLAPFEVLSKWMASNEQGCRDWVNAQFKPFWLEEETRKEGLS